jgi:hypothetical protein
MGKLAFLLGLAVVLMVVFVSGAELAGKIGVAAFLVACTVLGLATQRYEYRDSA